MRAPHGNIVEHGTTSSDSLNFSWLGNKGYGVDYITLGGHDKVIGTVFDDSFTLGRDAEIIDGSSGWDTVIYSNSTIGVDVNLNNTVQHGGYAEGDQLYHIESVTGSQYNDVLIGNGGHNVLDGQAGNDKIYAGDGDDTLYGGDGNDYLFGEGGDDKIYGDNGADYIDGGSGRDLVNYSQSIAGVDVNLNRTVQYGGFAEGDQLHNVENLTGSQYKDALVGNSDDNVIDGQGGNDKIYGGDGNDTLHGGDGNDFLSGDAGNDTLYGEYGNDIMRGGTGTNHFDGGDGTDTVDYRASAYGAIVDLNGTFFVSGEKDAQGHYYSTDTYTSIENVEGSNYNDGVFGTADDNVIDGNAGDDLLFGFDGDDTINGGDQNDIIEGGAGADKLNGGTGVNTLSYSASSAGVSINLAAGTANGGDAAGDSYVNFQNIIGSNHDDALIGSGDDNVLIEQSGNNFLAGGAGNDTFAFVANQSSTDVIADFHVGEDKLAFMGASNMSDLHVAQAGANTIVSFDNGQGIIALDNVNASDLMAHASTTFEFPDSLATLVS